MHARRGRGSSSRLSRGRPFPRRRHLLSSLFSPCLLLRPTCHPLLVPPVVSLDCLSCCVWRPQPQKPSSTKICSGDAIFIQQIVARVSPASMASKSTSLWPSTAARVHDRPPRWCLTSCSRPHIRILSTPRVSINGQPARGNLDLQVTMT